MNMEWIYENNEDNSARFVLGQVLNPTEKTLLCFGINPSTACPEKLDSTIRKIISICNYNGHQKQKDTRKVSFFVFAIYGIEHAHAKIKIKILGKSSTRESGT